MHGCSRNNMHRPRDGEHLNLIELHVSEIKCALSRDAIVSDPNLGLVLPKDSADAPTLKSLFASKGFTPQELVRTA